MGESSRTLVVGDVHGCFDELLELVALAGIGESDLVVSVGDLVDRGPKSLEAMEWFLRGGPNRKAVRGNHEQKHLKQGSEALLSWIAGRVLKVSCGDSGYARILELAAEMPAYLDLPHALVAHAGIEPGVKMEEQDPQTLMGVGSGRRPGFDGKSPWWFESEKMDISKPLVFGHEKHEHGIVRACGGLVWGIDTGASMGGWLTGVLLPEGKVFQVKAKDYWSEALKEWGSLALGPDMESMPWKPLLKLRQASAHWSDIEAAGKVRGACEGFAEAKALVESRRARLLESSGYERKKPAGRRALLESLRSEAKDLADEIAISAFPNKDLGEALAKRLPNWRELSAALAEKALG